MSSRSEARPEAALYLRNVNGEADPDGLYRHFFGVARGIRTARYTMEVAIRRDGGLDSIQIYDDWLDPYQLHNIDYREVPELFASLAAQLSALLEESNDSWYRDGTWDKIWKQI